MRYTDAPTRRDELLRRLRENGYLSSREVAAEIGVSEMTIRRDLTRMDAEGLAHRVPGGATAPGATGLETFDRRERRGQAPKQAIARAAVAALDGAETVALDGGTTVAAVAPLLPAGTRVISHSMPVLSACEHRTDLEVIGLGGVYHPLTRSFGGPAARAAAEELAADVALISAVAVAADGLYCTASWDAEMKQVFTLRAERTMVLVDHTKAGARAPLRFLQWDQVDTLVTDRGIDDLTVRRWREAAGHVIVAR
ncbi:DeoR/GlpR family DNA-binding transcription regulator [Ruania halotolerans]|uniref:DeoR/GlpR family DNA-binding transcription regulator n=1 Tax=Ruania halotolerans TaxID=2897773 RepID=UPI001E2D1F5C|nr:DeoR/GlpR family DNA-binding transcription regulator [Ruania halotolerans]UFU08162.1 DeoR/GlpR family DNA-binding transcription regulator [Ruania halotolerans]